MSVTIDTARIRTPITADNTQFLKALDQSLGGVRSFADKASAAMKKAGKTLSLAVTAPILGAAAAAVKMGVDLDREMRNIQSVSKSTDTELAALSDTFVDMSTDITKTTDTAVGLAAGFYDIQGSGFAGAAGMQVLEAATKAASAGLTSTEVASGALTASLNAYGQGAESAQSFSDLLFRTVDVGVGTFEELSNSIGYVVGTAAQAGVGFDEVSAALATASKQGISFDKGARAINMLLLALIDPSKEMADALGEIGYKSGQAALDAMGLGGTLQALEAAGYGGTEGLASLGLSSMALRGALALTGEGADMFAGDLNAMKTASEGAGATQEAFAIQTKSVAMQMANAKNKLMALALGFSEMLLPPLLEALGVAGQWLDKLLAMDDHTKKVILVVAGLAAALGPALMIMGTIVSTVGALVPLFSAMAGGISLAVTAVGILTSAATTLGAAMMTIAPLAVIAGLALLAKKVYDNIQAHQELAAEAIHTSTSYTAYKLAVEDSDRWTVTLSEDVWKLVQAKIELQGATGEAAAALAAEGIEQQKLLDAMQKATEIQAGMAGHIAKEVYMRGEAAKVLALQDEALRATAVARGLLTQAEVDAYVALKAADERLVASSERQRQWTKEVKNATVAADTWMGKLGAVKEQLGAQATATEAYTARLQGMAEMWKEKVKAAVEAIGQAFQELGDTIGSGYEQMKASADTYYAAMTSAQTQYDQQILQIAESGAQARFFALEKYQLSQAQVLAKYQAEAAALSAAGQTERLADLTRSFEESSTMAQYAFDMAEAQRIQSEAIQTHAAQVAHVQREYDAALAHYNELAELQKFIGNKIMMWIALHKQEIDMAGGNADNMLRSVSEMFGSQLSLADQFNIGWQSFMKDWAENSGKAIEGAAKYWEGLHQTMKGELDAGAATMAAAQDKLDAIGAGWSPPALQAPAMPDFAQFTADYSSGVGGGLSRAGSQITESATKSMKQVVVDIAKAFETAMATFKKVAEYRPATGLAAGMEALRKDIQEAVRQLYLAYESLGKEGVEGAGLIAEAASKVFDAIGKAVDTFGKLAEYTAPLRSALDSVLADVKYVLVKVRTELLDLWGWAGAREDTVWGHMMSWSEAVGGIVGLVGQAADTFSGLKEYTGIMPGVIEVLVADIQAVLTEMQSVDPSGVDEALVQWAELSAGLISAITSMTNDLETLAGLEGGLVISSMSLVNLLEAIKNTTAIIAGFFIAQPHLFDEATAATSEAATAWLELNGKLISLVAGMTDDLETIATFEGGLQISSTSLANLLEAIKNATALIAGFFSAQPHLFDEATAKIVASAIAWLELNSRLVSLVAGVIEDLTKVTEFEGGLVVSASNVTNLIDSLKLATETIVQAMGAVEDYTQGKGAVIAKVYTAWLEFKAALVSTLAGIIDDLVKLAEFEGGLTVNAANVTNLIDELKVATETIVQAMGAVEDYTKDKGAVIAAVYTAWLEFKSSLVSTLAGVIDDMEKIAGLEGGLEVSAANVTNLMESLSTATETILEATGDVSDKFEEGDIKVEYEMQAAWLELNAKLVSTMAGIVDDIEKLATFEGVDEVAFQAGLDNLFDALYGFLDEFNQRAGLFAGVVSEDGAEIAELMGRTAKALGDAVQPVTDVAEFAVSPAEAEVAIGLFFEALALFLEKFKEKADDFAKQANKDTADLAKIIGDTVSGIGGAVEPLVKILEYNPEVKDIEAQFEKFFWHLNRALWWIEHTKNDWTISDAAIELAAKVDEAMGHLKSAADFLHEMGTYGEDQTNLALAGFISFLVDLGDIIGEIDTARGSVEFEALGAAEEFASGCSTMLGHITDGINTLNSLPQLAIDFYLTGEGLGINFIQGMIDGLINNASALYMTIMTIVQNAIAAAETAAGVASPSKEMWELGEQMRAGLTGALAAGTREASLAMQGLVGGALAPAYAYAAPGGGAAGTTYSETNYHLHEGEVSPERRASLRQQFEALEMYNRVRG